MREGFNFIEYCEISIIYSGANGMVEIPGLMDGWMTCDLASFSTEFQSYQSKCWVKMKDCVQWNLCYDWKYYCLERLTYSATGAPDSKS